MRAAEILAAAETIDGFRRIAHAFSETVNMEIKVRLCLYFKDLFTFLCRPRNSTDRSMRCDVACIRFKFETGNVEKISRTPVKLNMADVLTKEDSILTDAFQSTLLTNIVDDSFQDFAESKTAE